MFNRISMRQIQQQEPQRRSIFLKIKKYWLEIILILAISLLLCGIVCAEEIDSAIYMLCPEHGELTENEVLTLVVLGSENYICLHCAARLWKNNREEVNKMIEKFEKHK